MKFRNIAIIAHVDHGKTTLLDGLLKQSKTFRENESFMSQDLIMDSNDQERERGITILAKNTAVTYKDVKINIIDTPGHSDFGGEVERTLNMADGALLLVDAQEGPMPQTKFVLKKALELHLKIIVIINKIDKKDARIPETLRKVNNLFIELATHDAHLEFPVLYAVGRDGKSWNEMPADFNAPADLSPIFEAILKYLPSPIIDLDSPFQMLVSTLAWDNYRGKYVIGRITRGKIKPGIKAVLLKADGRKEDVTIEKIFVNQGLKRVECDEIISGDIASLTGIKNAEIGDTIADASNPEALPVIQIDEPTLKMSVGPNTSPFMGKEGKFFTSRQILERINRELQTNVAMKFETDENGQFIISGRGELHLSVFLETLRREGYEIEVGKPKVITKIIDSKIMEPVEELTIDVDNEFSGPVKSEIGKRRGILLSQEEITSNTARLIFEITTRAQLGLRNTLLTLSKGTAVTSTMFIRYDKAGGDTARGSALSSLAPLGGLRKGVLVASAEGKSASYGLSAAEEKGPLFIGPQTLVYEGMIVGVNGRDEDLELNVCREKQLTNNRSSGEEGISLTPPTLLSLEQSISFLEDDELLEITPKNLRLRKKVLKSALRHRQSIRLKLE